jgi:hypothetical protein
MYWVTHKPTSPGVYWIKVLDKDKNETRALIQVVKVNDEIKCMYNEDPAHIETCWSNCPIQEPINISDMVYNTFIKELSFTHNDRKVVLIHKNKDVLLTVEVPENNTLNTIDIFNIIMAMNSLDWSVDIEVINTDEVYKEWLKNLQQVLLS